MSFSMEWIRIRCRQDPDTGCLLWLQATAPRGAPVASKRKPDGTRPTLQLRRVVWEHRNGPIPAGMVVTNACQHANCLMHLELVTKGEVVRRQWAKTDARAKLVAGVTRASRARSKLDMDKARAIRHSNKTLEVVAAEYGISVTLASFIRRGERWKDAADPFAGLGT